MSKSTEQPATFASLLLQMSHDYGATDCRAREGGFPLDGIHCRKCALESLERRVVALRDKVADGIISGPMRDNNNDYDSGACDAEIAMETALTALLGGQDGQGGRG